MLALEIGLWAGAAWAMFFGYRATLGLTHIWSDLRKRRTAYTFLALGLLQFGALAFFISAALWAHTLRALS